MLNETDVHLLTIAISLAHSSREHGNHPFGALLADERETIVLQAENTVITDKDCTGHAELNLVRLASQQLSQQSLAQCTLYTSTEPCPMCAGRDILEWDRQGYLRVECRGSVRTYRKHD